MERPSIPEGWTVQERLTLTKEVGFGLTGAATLLALAAALGFAILAQSMEIPLTWARGTWVAWIVGLGITMVLHEAVHGLLARRYGAKPRYGLGVVGIFPYAYCDPAWTFRRRPYLAVALGPLVILDLLALAAMLWIPGASPIAYAILVLNTSGAVGDLWVAWRALRAPAQVLIAEEANVITLYFEKPWRQTTRPEWPGHLAFGSTVALPVFVLPFLLFIGLDLATPAGVERTVEILPFPLLRMATFQSDPVSGSGISVDLMGLLVWYLLIALGAAVLRRRWTQRRTQ